MAMPFGHPELDRLYSTAWKDAVKATGFDLGRIDDPPAAGLIDDRLRVEIRNCRFLLAELTYANNGAYWEAGYAEGLGRPVIYLCERGSFENPTTTPHFDANHHTTVVWEMGELAKAVDLLKVTIRATLPAEAKMND